MSWQVLVGGSLALRKAICETILDVSFARTGGCLAVVRLVDVKKLVVEEGTSGQSVIKRDDLVKKPTSEKQDYKLPGSGPEIPKPEPDSPQ